MIFRQPFTLIATGALAGLMILIGCSRQDLAGPGDQPAVDSAKSMDQTLINGFLVQYDGRTNDGERTTFSYTVTGTGEVSPLTEFRLLLPACAGEVSAFAPTDSVRLYHDDATTSQVIAWALTIEGDDTVGRQYTITFPGDVPEGAIRAGVRALDELEAGQVPGPCAGYEIAGSVYVDADADGERDPDELGIANVAVEIVDEDGSVAAALTDADGDYSIMRTEGIYVVRLVDDGYPDAFNAELAASFEATTPLQIPVSVRPQSVGNDFGFSPLTEQLIEDLESGDLPTDGESVKFWTIQFAAVLEDLDHDGAVYDAEELEAFLAAIEELYLEEIYQFSEGNELQEALDILRARPCDTVAECDPLVLLAREMLATELNEVTGRGLIENLALQDVLLAWGEAVWVEGQALLRATGPEGLVAALERMSEQLRPAIRLFEAINTGGGGSVDE